MEVIIGILEEGLVYAIMALGVYITYRILDFPDLSVDGTFPLGSAIAAVLIVKGINPLLTLPIAFLAGGLSGILTGLIHVRLKVRDLLSGIIMMTALYSLNLRIAGSANLPIFSKSSIFDNPLLNRIIPDYFRPYLVLAILLIIAAIMKLILDIYLKTRSGYLLRAVGDNDTLVTSLAKDKGTVKIVGLAIANAYVALAGSIYAQMSGFFEVSTGTGTVVIGLASVIIGTNLFKRMPLRATTSVIIGSILYKACVAAAISFGMEARDLKLITSILFLLILVVSHDRKRRVKANA
jgi:putative ABC transport system permease protein